jgi:hypothetical protein
MVSHDKTITGARLMLGLLLVAAASWTGCSNESATLFVLHPITQTFARHSNPIEGWKSVGRVDCKDGEMSAEITPISGYEAISDDVQKYVNKLPVDHFSDCTRRWCYWIFDMQFYEDGTGKHAVGFTIYHSDTIWGYVLIYDKNNKRVKAVRYVQGYSMS